MIRIITLSYDILAYAFLVVTFLVAIAFIGNLGPWKSIDSGPIGPLMPAVAIDLGLLFLLALQHRVMTRQASRRAYTPGIPEASQRSTSVLAASLVSIALVWQWRPIPTPIWSLPDIPSALLQVTFWLGWGLLLSTLLLGHFKLLGLYHVYSPMHSLEWPAPAPPTRSHDRVVAHLPYLALLLSLWSAPLMSVGHLLLSLVATAYILVRLVLEAAHPTDFVERRRSKLSSDTSVSVESRHRHSPRAAGTPLSATHTTIPALFAAEHPPTFRTAPQSVTSPLTNPNAYPNSSRSPGE